MIRNIVIPEWIKISTFKLKELSSLKETWEILAIPHAKESIVSGTSDIHKGNVIQLSDLK